MQEDHRGLGLSYQYTGQFDDTVRGGCTIDNTVILYRAGCTRH
jgi:hypothetical protein